VTAATNGRIAGATFLIYIAAGLTSMMWSSRPHALAIVLQFVMWLSALTLGVTLYAITRDQNREIAMLAMLARVSEALASEMLYSATYFAVGSTLFCWLLLRGRIIPASLAWTGLVASLILVVVLPLQIAGLVSGGITQIVWLPMLAFEVPAGVWLLLKGVRLQ
jgi:hypothetical protein